MEKQTKEMSYDIKALYENERKWCENVDLWQKIVNNDEDYGYLHSEPTNSVYTSRRFEWCHYGYSRREHHSIQQMYDLDYDNACLIQYTVRQLDIERGPSSDIHGFIDSALDERDYSFLGTTSDDEYGTHLTYWYLKEFFPPEYNPEYDPDDEDDEPYDRWNDPYEDCDY